MCIVASLEDPMICQCVDNSAQNGIEYLYTIQSLDIQGASPHSVRASGMAKLPPPQKLVVEPLHEQGMCLLSWNSVVAAVGYRIERKDAATAWITIGRLVDGPTKFVDSSQLIYDTTYSYKIYAFDAFSESLPTLYPGAVMLLSPKHQDEKPGAIDIRFGDLVTEQVGKQNVL